MADAPLLFSTCTTLCGQLFTFGGNTSASQNNPFPSDNVYTHDPSRNTWKLVSNLKTPQFKSLVAALPGNELMVVGGITDTGFNTDAVEMASVVQHATSVL